VKQNKTIKHFYIKGFTAHVTALKANARKINNAVEKYVKLQNYVAFLLLFFYFVCSATAYFLDRPRRTQVMVH